MTRFSLYLIVLAALFTSVYSKSPPLTAAIPINRNLGTCPGNSASCSSSIGQPTWCCPSDGRCVYGNGGIVACCEYSITCDDEAGSGGQDPNQNNVDPIPSPTAIVPEGVVVSTTIVVGTVETVTGPGGNIITVSPTTNVVITDVNENWGLRERKGSNVAWVGVLLALGWILRG